MGFNILLSTLYCNFTKFILSFGFGTSYSFFLYVQIKHDFLTQLICTIGFGL